MGRLSSSFSLVYRLSFICVTSSTTRVLDWNISSLLFASRRQILVVFEQMQLFGIGEEQPAYIVRIAACRGWGVVSGAQRYQYTEYSVRIATLSRASA